MAQINAYLNFKDQAREAMEFYKGVFGGKLEIQTIGQSPMAKETPKEVHNRVMHATLQGGGVMLMAADSSKPENYKIGNAIILSVNCDSEEEIQDLFKKLSVGANVTMALAQQFWGATFGMLTDKFGLHWMMNFQSKK